MSRQGKQQMRNRWTEEDDLMVRVALGQEGRVEYPAALLARHTRQSCNKRGCALGFTNPRRNRRLDYESNLAASPEAAGWLAGLIDGEGCLTGIRDRPSVKIVSTDREVIERVKELVPSFIAYFDKPYFRPGLTTWKNRHDAVLGYRHGCHELAREVGHLLVINRKRDLMLSWIE